jgi:hypothetical protein
MILNKKYTWSSRAKQQNTWKRFSRQLGLRILYVLENKKIDPAAFAELLNVSTKTVRRILHGQENLDLLTISKMSTILDTELITFQKYKYRS